MERDNLRWGKLALTYASRLTTEFLGRGSATQKELDAAKFVRDELEKMGVKKVSMQPFYGLRSIWIFFAFVFGIALSGHVAFWLLRVPLGELPAVLVSMLFFFGSGFLLYRKFTFQEVYLSKFLPYGKSNNVIGKVPPEKDVKQRVVMIGHLDTHRAVLWYAKDFLLKIYAVISPIVLLGVWVAPLFYLLAALTHFRLFAWMGLAIGVLHLMAWFTGMTADLGVYSPGANDNASAVGTLLALGKRLQEEPLAHTEVWLTFTGCEETGCDGIKAFLDEHEGELKEAFFLDFELVGIGDRLMYLRTEGVIRKRSIDQQVEALVNEVGEQFGLSPIEGAGSGAFTEMGVVWERGLKGVCIVAMRENGVLPPEWHRISDVPDNLEVGTLQRTHDFAWLLLKSLDGGAFLSMEKN